MTYYNTTNQTNPTLLEYKRINSSQDETILRCFKKYRYGKFTPFMIQSLCGLPSSVPITSIRRSINALTNAGYLVKLNEKKAGMYNRANCLWTLKDETI